MAKKLTLTPQEHRRVIDVMGNVSTKGGYRHCRSCGEQVRWVPQDIWEHTLACERRQRRERSDGEQREREREVIAQAIESDQAESDERVGIRRSSVGRNGSGGHAGRESIMATTTKKRGKRGAAPSRARSATTTAAPRKRTEDHVSTREAVLRVMRRHPGPMPLRDITDRVLKTLSLSTKTPRASVAKAISVEVHKGNAGAIKKVGPGTYELREPKQKK